MPALTALAVAALAASTAASVKTLTTKAPKAPTIPKPPSDADNTAALTAALTQQKGMSNPNGMAGRQGTILTGPNGLQNEPLNTQRKTLVGS